MLTIIPVIYLFFCWMTVAWTDGGT